MEKLGNTMNSDPMSNGFGNKFNFSSYGNFSNGHPVFNPSRFPDNGMDTSTAPILLGVGGSLLVLAVLLLAARLWSRLSSGIRLHADDWTVLAATILAMINYIILSLSVFYGLGRRTRFVSFTRRGTALELLFISQVFWYWSITLVKLSVACLLLRIKATKKPWRIFLYTTMTFLVLAAIVQTCFQFLQCRPFRVFWDPRAFREPGGVHCFKRAVINGNIVAFSTVQVAVDLIFSFIPITFIRKLNRPRREKIFMCLLMALGLFASCGAVIRTLTLQGFYTSPDLFRTNVMIALWAVVEQWFALIAATIPTLKAFLENALIRVGLFFYDEDSESKVRGRLVQFGLLGEEETLVEITRKPSTLDSPTPRKMRDEFGDSMIDLKNDKEVEDMLAKMAV